jgi:hypothetical protein
LDRGRQDAHLFRLQAEDTRQPVAVHVGGLRAAADLDPVADAAGAGGLRLDIGVFDEAGGKVAGDPDSRALHRPGRIAARHVAPAHHVPRARRVQQVGRRRILCRQHRRALLPGDRKGRKMGKTLCRTDNGGDGFAPVFRLPHGKHRLVDETGDDAEQVVARHVGGGQDQV